MLIFGQKSCLTKIKSYCITYFLSNSSVFLVSTFALFGLPHMSEDYKYYVIPYAAPYILPILQTFLTISVYATVAIGQNIVLFSSSYSLRLWVMRQNETTKGQLISECLFEKIVWTKIPTKNLIDSAQQRLLLQG